MLAMLRFYISGKDTGWQEASLLAATSIGKGQSVARTLHGWIWDFLQDNEKLPISLHHGSMSRIKDEDLASEIHNHLQSLGKKYLSAMDVIHHPNQSEVQARFKLKQTPDKSTAARWMAAMEYRYRKEENGMYIDGPEREDVVNYCKKVFLPFWTEIEQQMMIWNENNEATVPKLPDFPYTKRVVLVTHDESTFYANDRRKTQWIHKSEKATPNPKGEGASIMVSDFCSPDFGWLHSKDGKEEA